MSAQLHGAGVSWEEADLIVVGAGIAGSETAWATARGGLKTLLISTSLDTVYNVAASSVTLEPPAGSLMAAVTPRARGQDGAVPLGSLHREVKLALQQEPNLHLLQSSVSTLLIDQERVVGVTTWEGIERRAPRVALTVGSFLQARLRIGESVEEAGRLSEMAYDDLYLDLKALGFEFTPAVLEAPAAKGALAYTVTCQTFASGELPDGTARLKRLRGLYAAGLCASGYLTYEEAAKRGQIVARELLTT